MGRECQLTETRRYSSRPGGRTTTTLRRLDRSFYNIVESKRLTNERSFSTNATFRSLPPRSCTSLMIHTNRPLVISIRASTRIEVTAVRAGNYFKCFLRSVCMRVLRACAIRHSRKDAYPFVRETKEKSMQESRFSCISNRRSCFIIWRSSKRRSRDEKTLSQSLRRAASSLVTSRSNPPDIYFHSLIHARAHARWCTCSVRAFPPTMQTSH